MSVKTNIIILNRVPLSRSPYHEWLDLDAHALYLLTDAGTADDLGPARAAYAEIHEFEHYVHNANVELCARALGQRIAVEAIVAYSEVDQIRAARCRQALGVPGQDLVSALAFRDKLDMRDRCRAAGLAGPAYARIDDVGDLRGFIDANGYPVVVKPRLSTASRSVVRLDDDADLARFLVRGLYTDIDVGPPAMVEAFVEGDLYAVDLLLAGGEVVFFEALRYVNTCLDYSSRACKSVGLAQVPADHPDVPRLDRFCRELLRHFPHPGHGGFHIEAFVGPREVVLCEAASRSGGAGVPQLIERSAGFNPDRATVQLQASHGRDRSWLGASPGSERAYGFLLLAPGDVAGGWQTPARSELDFIVDYEPAAAPCGAVDDVAKFAAFAMVEGESIGAMQSHLEQLERWFHGDRSADRHE